MSRFCSQYTLLGEAVVSLYEYDDHNGLKSEKKNAI